MGDAAPTHPDLGPVQLIAVGFGPDHRFEGHVLEELERLEGAGTIRLLDLLFVMHDGDELVALSYQGESLGGIVGSLLGFEFEGEAAPPPMPVVATDDRPFGMTREDVEDLAGAIPPGQAAAFMLFEHVWARDLKRAVTAAGGVPLGEGFLTAEAISFVDPELVAMAGELDALQTVGDAGVAG